MTYEDLYRSGGFGYEQDRAKWVKWVKRHYVGEFELLRTTRRPRPTSVKSALVEVPIRLRAMIRPRPRPKPTLLDIPCGDGFWTSVFRDLGFDAMGIDRSRAGIEHAKLTYPGIEFAVGNAEKALPVDGAHFDVVFSRGITHLHFDDLERPETHAMARNLIRYVGPGGQLLVSYYSKRDGGGTERHHYHQLWELVRLFESVGEIRRVDVVQNFVQISVEPRG